MYNPRAIEAFGSANPRFNTQHLTTNNQYPIPNTQHLTTNNQYPIAKTQHLTTNNQYSIPDIQFISPDGFYNWEAIAADGETIATISYDSENLTQPYEIAVDAQIIHRTNTQSKAENYIIWHYKNQSLPIIEKEFTEPCTIEDCNFLEERGQQYIFRINNQMIGYIWLSDDDGWVNSDGKQYDDWIECGLALTKTIRNDLYQEHQRLAA